MSIVNEIKANSFEVISYLSNVTGGKFEMGKNVKSWFRADKHPSVKFYKGSGGDYVYHDFAGDHYDCIALWATVYNMTMPEAIKDIARQFLNLDGLNSTQIDRPKLPPPPPPQPIPLVYCDSAEMVASCNPKYYKENNLAKWLCTILGERLAYQALERYAVGTSNKSMYGEGATVFWHVDRHGVRYAKIMQYDPTNGKRRRDFDKPAFVPISHLKRGFTACFFGEHLLTGNTETVAIVESEKTAIVASIFLPQFIWLASGGVKGIIDRKLGALKGRDVRLVADNDIAGREGFEAANKRLLAAGIAALVTTLQGANDKTDLCDYIADRLRTIARQP
jgi:hypothetical protein